MELRAIADKPLTGHGFGKALGAYGDAQAEYFETEERGQERVRIAGCPEYAFNEYLRMGMEFGSLACCCRWLSLFSERRCYAVQILPFITKVIVLTQR